ncbi:hypothetical protein HMN09_01153500 [Mycena chlorophos]|uniref:Uncharacterized protein n=1 Tax=Mycena chlorophos TaxID=658473 RepID=A0A8H6SAE7_MYCCL|nr:hypothetical protein HMN09_01153500 [Mycena chlorophos]
MANGAGCWLLSRNTSYGLVLGLDALESVEKVHQSSMRIPLPGLVTPNKISADFIYCHPQQPHLEPDAAIPNATDAPNVKIPTSSLSDITNV